MNLPSEDKVSPKEVVDLICRLRCLGLDDKVFRTLHHSRDFMNGFEAYCRSKQSFRAISENRRTYARLKLLFEALHTDQAISKETETIAVLAKCSLAERPIR